MKPKKINNRVYELRLRSFVQYAMDGEKVLVYLCQWRHGVLVRTLIKVYP